MPSRTQVARYLAKELPTATGQERQALIAKTANWLKNNGQAKNIDHLVQDIASALTDTGYVFATVTTAREMSASQKSSVEAFIKKQLSAQNTEVVYKVDRGLIGGITIETAKGTFDNSVQGKLNRMLENIG